MIAQVPLSQNAPLQTGILSLFHSRGFDGFPVLTTQRQNYHVGPVVKTMAWDQEVRNSILQRDTS